MAIIPPIVQLVPLAGSGREPPAAFGELYIQSVQDDARLNADPIVAGLQDRREVNAEIDDQAMTERFTGHSRAGPAGHERDRTLVGVADNEAAGRLRRGDGDGQGLDLKQSWRRSSRGRGRPVEEQFAAEMAAEIVAKPSPKGRRVQGPAPDRSRTWAAGC